MLCNFLGVAGLAGIFIMVFSMPLNTQLSRKMGAFTRRTMALRDRRVKFTSELLQGVRLLKLFAWEPSLLEQLGERRTAELKQVRNNLLLGGGWGDLPAKPPSARSEPARSEPADAGMELAEEGTPQQRVAT